jgi:hypothetical protein
MFLVMQLVCQSLVLLREIARCDFAERRRLQHQNTGAIGAQQQYQNNSQRGI